MIGFRLFEWEGTPGFTKNAFDRPGPHPVKGKVLS
jgi:hypothetical protein